MNRKSTHHDIGHTWETHNPRPTPDLREPRSTTHANLREPRPMPNLVHPQLVMEPWPTKKMERIWLGQVAYSGLWWWWLAIGLVTMGSAMVAWWWCSCPPWVLGRAIHGPHHPTNLLDPLETDLPPPELTNPTVGGGSPPTEPEPFGSVGGFPPQKPEPLDSTITSTTSGDIQRFSDKKWKMPTIFLLFWRRSTWNPPDLAIFCWDLVQIRRIRPNIG